MLVEAGIFTNDLNIIIIIIIIIINIIIIFNVVDFYIIILYWLGFTTRRHDFSRAVSMTPSYKNKLDKIRLIYRKNTVVVRHRPSGPKRPTSIVSCVFS